MKTKKVSNGLFAVCALLSLVVGLGTGCGGGGGGGGGADTSNTPPPTDMGEPPAYNPDPNPPAVP